MKEKEVILDHVGYRTYWASVNEWLRSRMHTSKQALFGLQKKNKPQGLG